MKEEKDQRDKKRAENEKKQAKLQALASQLAPAEEWSESESTWKADTVDPFAEADDDYVDGSLILDGDHLDLPRQILPADEDRASSWANPVLLTVLSLSLGFTALIAYLISLNEG